jgi:hypothetical protein
MLKDINAFCLDRQEHGGSEIAELVDRYVRLESVLSPSMSEDAVDRLLEEQEYLAEDIIDAPSAGCPDAVLKLVPFVLQCLDRHGRERDDLTATERAVVSALRGFIQLRRQNKECLRAAA